MSAFPTQFAAPSASFSSSSSSSSFSSAKLPAPADAYIPWTPAPAPIDLHLAAHAKARQTKFVESTAQRRQRVEFLRRREWTRRIAEWIDSAAAGNSGAEPPQAKALAPITYSWADILAAADADDDYEDAPSPSYSPSPAPSAAPFSSSPAPFSSSPAPFSSSPAPFSSSPAPFSSSPAPFSSSPAPFSSSPAPFSSSPAPFSSSPAPSPYPAYAYPYPYTPDELDDDEPYVIYTASPRSSTCAGPLPPYTPPAYPARPPALSWHPVPSPALTLPARRRSGLSPRSRHSSLSSISEEEEPVPAPCV